MFGQIEAEVSDYANSDITILEEGISCSFGCVFHSFGQNIILANKRRVIPPNFICK
jgi:hypothetical protein